MRTVPPAYLFNGTSGHCERVDDFDRKRAHVLSSALCDFLAEALNSPGESTFQHLSGRRSNDRHAFSFCRP